MLDNMRNLLARKQGMSISIVLFVIMVIILFVTAITLFYLRNKTFNGDVQSSKSSDDVMYKKVLLDFYLTQISNQTDKNQPIASFELGLQKYQLKSGNYVIPELAEIEKQVDDKHILVQDGKLKVNLNLTLISQMLDPKNQMVSDSTKYDYKFSYIGN
jgi:hypothetical protein